MSKPVSEQLVVGPPVVGPAVAGRFWRARGVRFVFAESLALATLGLAALWVLSGIDFVTDQVQVQPWHFAAALGATLAVYWTLEMLGGDRGPRIAFWLAVPALMLPHAVVAWTHNRIVWHELLEVSESVTPARSVMRDLAVFVTCLGVSMILHRVIGLRRLTRHMRVRQVEPHDQRHLARNESFVLAGVIAAGLVATTAVAGVGAVLARYDGWLESSGRAAAAIGSTGAILLALTLWLWFRGRHRTS